MHSQTHSLDSIENHSPIGAYTSGNITSFDGAGMLSDSGIAITNVARLDGTEPFIGDILVSKNDASLKLLAVGESAASIFLETQSSATHDVSINFRGMNAGLPQDFVLGFGSVNNAFQILTGTDYSTGSGITIDNNGKVGIGIYIPTSPLTVHSNHNGNTVNITNNDTVNGYGLFIKGGGTATNHYALAVRNAADEDLLIVNANKDIFTVVRTDHASTSTITGWSSTTTKYIYVWVLGKEVFVNYYIAGTSDASTGTEAKFTLPYTSTNDIQIDFVQGYAANNGSALSTATRGLLNENSSIVYLYTDTESGAWTASGTKVVSGQFHYTRQ